ncbi:hypothetical protein BKA62DRAFT_468969 [Auriculariales sp. MPI-PUGE-AT-0066]|nr:hypothetical protein BKA62DRAFT_468969 [Auriculariales sp. MPI-PUGE-AT-0066]
MAALEPAPIAKAALIPSAGWWPSRDAKTRRPWKDPPTRKATIPPEQAEAFARTAKLVASATADIAHQTLEVAKEILDFAPIPGLGKAVGLLLVIWDTCQVIESNRLACLRLTERAAEILVSVRNEVYTAGNDVVDVLDAPLGSLAASFEKVLDFLQKQAQRPFLKRYLKREDDLLKIDQLEESLQDALSLFSVAIQTRLLQHVKRIEQTLSSSSLGLDLHAMSSTITLTPSSPHSPHNISPPTFTAAIQSSPLFVTDHDRARADAVRDRADFDARIREALSRGTDVALFALLEIPKEELPEAQFALRRALEEMVSTNQPSADDERQARFDFDREFMEQSIDALTRLSDYRPVPSWAVTKLEVDREELIGQGSFAEVYRGKWRGENVAIKVLAPVTPPGIFKREIEIWRLLKHRHVLPIWAASSPGGGPPYFFLSPYMSNGSLPQYLRHHRPIPHERLRFMHEIALGLQYLHSKDVLHGDMKAANVLVNGQSSCVITDFGQSDVRTEVWRLSQQAPPHRTLRWLAPEIMDGEGELTPAADVYAFAISCVEIMTCGEVPWSRIDDFSVRNLVINLDKRPTLPHTPDAEAVESLIKRWWARDPLQRPSCPAIVAELQIRRGLSPSRISMELPGTPKGYERPLSILSPPLHPIEIPRREPRSRVTIVEETATIDWSPQDGSISSSSFHSAVTHLVSSSSSSSSSEGGVADTQSLRTVASGSTETHETEESEPEPQSPLPVDDDAALRRDERRYRLCLLHEFHPSLKLPLWKPKRVQLGAVGFVDKAKGSFTTLLNAFDPAGTAQGRLCALPPMTQYGPMPTIGEQRCEAPIPTSPEPVRTGWRVTSSFPFLSSRPPMKQHTTRLHARRKEAFLFIEASTYRYFEDLAAPREWFSQHIDVILQEHGRIYRLQREDVFLVIGALDAQDWAAFVSHASNGGLLHLNVRHESNRRTGQPWASFAHEVPVMEKQGGEGTGPSYPEDSVATVSSHRISLTNAEARESDSWDTVLLARLRYRPDSEKPTSS